jgi:digeranylgeranylglycerophospholipid reductase
MFDMDEFDVIVVGGGLAGCAAAIGGAEKGLSVMVLESRARDRIDNADTSFEALQNLTRREDTLDHFRSYGIDLVPEYPYKGAIINGPGGSQVDFRLNRYHGYFVRRGGKGSIDDQMLKKVERTSTVIAYSSRVTGIDPDGTVNFIQNGHYIKVKGRTIIGADGIGTVAGSGIVPSLNKYDIAIGIGSHFSGPHGFEPGIAECWLGSELCPGEYAYVLPSENEVSVVTTMRPHILPKGKKPSDYLERFLSIPRIKEGLDGTEMISKIAGSVPVRPGKLLGRDRVLLAGEAARLTDPLLGFGIGNAIASGTIAGRSASLEDPLAVYERSEVRSFVRDNERR